ncbi:MAG: hypothetical protein KME26_02345 [Oscillatoria princeps RMCB-10]|nr:hypothetical protein [Oscillatoria princeps RMCB-10]
MPPKVGGSFNAGAVWGRVYKHSGLPRTVASGPAPTFMPHRRETGSVGSLKWDTPLGHGTLAGTRYDARRH